MIFPCPSFPKKQIENGRLLLLFQISLAGCGRKLKQVMRFQSETSVFKFLWLSVNGALKSPHRIVYF